MFPESCEIWLFWNKWQTRILQSPFKDTVRWIKIVFNFPYAVMSDRNDPLAVVLVDLCMDMYGIFTYIYHRF